MKRFLKNLSLSGLVLVFLFLAVITTKKTVNSTDTDQEILTNEISDDYPLDSLDNDDEDGRIKLAASNFYIVYNYSGKELGRRARLEDALKIANGYRIKLTSNIKVSYRVTIPRNMILDLNGYTMTFADRESEYFITVGKGVDFMIRSSRPNGKIVTNFRYSGIVHLAGNKSYTSAQQPVLRITDNVVLQNNNADTIKNHSGKVYISNATIRPTNRNWNAILTRWEQSAANGEPIVEVKGSNSKIHGIYMGQKINNSTYLYGGTVRIYEGWFYNNINNKPFNQASGMNSLYINGGNFLTTNLGASNKTSSTYRLVKEGSWYKAKRYSMPVFDTKGGTYLNGYRPAQYHYQGDRYNFPNVNQVRYGTVEQGFRFDNWYTSYSTANYTYSGGPYGWRTDGNMDNKTYYARWTYGVTFNANNVDTKGNTISTPVVGSQASTRFNAGKGVYNKIPAAKYSRQGYKLLGWSTNKNDKSTNITVDTKQFWNFDAHVKGGQLTLYAIWEPINLGSSYKVEYHFQQLDGSYFYDKAKDSRFYSTAGNTSNPSIASFSGHNISSEASHIAARNVYVKGDNSSVVKLYYNLKEYEAKFNFGHNATITNLDALRTKYGNDKVIVNGNNITIKYRWGETLTAPTLENRIGYTYQGWDKTFNNQNTPKLEINAVYTALKYDYIFALNRENDTYNKPISQTFDSLIKLPQVINYPGYVFAGWKDANGNVVDSNTRITETGGKTLYAYWKTNKPTSSIDLLFKSKDTVTFTNYTNYEYQLVKESDNTVVRDWQLGKGINITGLDPDTSYVLNIRVPKRVPTVASGQPPVKQYYEASDLVKAYTFRTLKANENAVNAFVEGGKIAITPEHGNNKVNYFIRTKDSTLIINGSKVNDTVTFLNGGVDQTYEIVYKVYDEYIYYGQDTKTGKDFTGVTTLNTADENFIIGENSISFTSDKTYEYSIDDGNTWVTSNEEGVFTFSNIATNTNYKFKVRHKASQNEPASFSDYVVSNSETKRHGIAPTEEERTHIIHETKDDGSFVITAKEGFVYFDTTDGGKDLITIPQNKEITVNSTTVIERAENNLFAESTANLEIITIEKPEVKEEDKNNITIEVLNNTAKIRPVTSGTNEYEYILVKDGEALENSIAGILNKSENDAFYLFENLEYTTTYKVYVRKSITGTDYKTEYVDSDKTVEIGKEQIPSDSDKFVVPDIVYSTEYDFDSKTHKILLGNRKDNFNYEYKNDNGDWILIDSTNTITGLKGNKIYDLRLQYEDNTTISDYITGFVMKTNKTPAEDIEHAPVIADVLENVITITETLEDHEYAITTIDNEDYSNITFIAHSVNGVTFYQVKINGEQTALDYNTEYKIIARRVETEESEVSNPLVLMVQKRVNGELETAKQTVFTNRRKTINVPLPEITSDMIDKIKLVYTENEQSLAVLENAGYEYVVINKNDYTEEFDIEKVLAEKEVSSTYLNEQVKLSDEFLVYIRKVEDDKNEPSQYVLLNNVIIEKQEKTLNGENPKLIIVKPDYDYIIIAMEKGYEYSIKGTDEWIAGFDGNYSFIGLNSNTEYTFVVRIPESDYFKASEIIKEVVGTTIKKPTSKIDGPENYEFADTDITATETTINIVAKEGYEYSLNNVDWFKANEGEIITFDNLESNTLYPVYVRHAETDRNQASKEVRVKEVKTLTEKPTKDNAFNELVITEKEIKFIPNEDYEYTHNGEVLIPDENGYITIPNLDENSDVLIDVKRKGDETSEEMVLKTKTKGIITDEHRNINLISDSTTIEVLNPNEELLYAISLNENETNLEFAGITEEGKLIFEELTPNTKYFIYYKTKETDTKTSSELESIEKWTTKLPGLDLTNEERNIDEYSVLLNQITFTAKEGLEYSIDGGRTFLEPINGKITVSNSSTITVRRKETTDNLPSALVTTTRKTPVKDVTKPAVDLVFDVTNLTNNSIEIANNTGEDLSKYEFSLDKINWFNLVENKLSFLELENNTTYNLYVRTKETSTALHSEAVAAKFRHNDLETETITTLKEKLDLSETEIVITNVTDTTVTIEANEIYQYSVDNGVTWLNPVKIDDEAVDPINYKVVFNKVDYKSFMVRVNTTNNKYYSDETPISNIRKYFDYNTELIVQNITSNSIVFDTTSASKFNNLRIRDYNTNDIVENGSLSPVTTYVINVDIKGDDFTEEIENLIITLVNGENKANSFTTIKRTITLIDNEEYAYVLEGAVVSRQGYVYSNTIDGEFSDSIFYTDGDTVYVKRLETVTDFESNAAIAKIFKQKAEIPTEVKLEFGDITYKSVEIKLEDTYEYSIDGENWITGVSGNNHIFEGLDPATRYDIYVRTKRIDSENIPDRVLESDPITYSVTTDSYEPEEKIKELIDYAEQLGVKDNPKFNDILEELKDNYRKMSNTSDIEKILEESKKAVDQLLAKEKTKFIDDLLLLGQKEGYEAENLQQIVQDAVKFVDEAASKNDFIDILEDTKKKLELQDSKNKAIKELEDLIKFDADNETEKKKYQDAIDEINKEETKTIDDVKKIVQDVKNDIHNNRISDAKDEIRRYNDQNGGTRDLSDVNRNLDGTQTKGQIREILEAEKVQIIKEKVSNELKNHAENINTGGALSDAVNKIINDAVNNVNNGNYDNDSSINDIVAETKTKIDNQILIEQKQAAIDKLKNDNPNPSDKVKEIIEEAIKEINESPSKEAIDKVTKEAETDIATSNKKDEVQKELEDHFKDLEKNLVDEQSDEIDKIIKEVVDNINKDNYDSDLSKVIEDAKDKIEKELLEEEKEKQIDKIIKDIEDILDGDEISKELEDKKQELIKDINDKKTVEEIKDLDKETIIKDANKEKVINDINKKIEELINSGNYSDKSKEELGKIKDEIKDKLKDDNLSVDDIKKELDNVLDKIKEVVVNRISNNELVKDNNLDATYPSDISDLNVEISNANGMKSTTKIVIAKVSLVQTNIEQIRNMLKEGKINNKEYRNILRNQTVFGQLNITLTDASGNTITDFEGTYHVSVLLPTEFLKNENITTIYLGEVIEAFATKREGNWVTFETTHFSDFYLIGDVPENKPTNLWIWIIILGVIIAVEMAVVTTKVVKDKKVKRLNSFTLLPILAMLIPISGKVIIIIEIIVILIFAAVILYLFLSNKNKVKAVEKN